MRLSKRSGQGIARRALRGALLALLAVASASATVPAEGADEPRVEGLLRSRMQTRSASDWIPIQVMLRKSDLPRERAARGRDIRARQQLALDRLPTSGFRLKRRYASANGFAGWATADTVDRLAQDPNVERVYLDRTLRKSMSEGSVLLGSDVLVAQGFTGAGVNVAILDTGVDTDNVFLGDGDIVAQQCFCDDTPAPATGCCPDGTAMQSAGNAAEDGDGHGTAMAGIVTSNWASSTGIAPAAGIVAVQVLSSEGVGTFSDLDAGLDWVQMNRVLYDIRVVNLSLSESGEYANANAFPCSNSTTADLIEDLVNAGVTVFAASGNNAYDNGISFPACAPDAISVGSYYDKDFSAAEFCVNSSCTQLCNDTPANEGAFACFTNAGPLLDVMMPSWRANTLDLGSVSQRVGGTSASTAYASAAAALLLSVDPTLQPDDIRGLLVNNGNPVTNPGNGSAYTATRLDQAYAVVLQSYDSDGDGVLDDGDGSGWIGDATCVGGQTMACDDNCASDPNALQEDWDGDGVGDACDNCLYFANSGQEDDDEDGQGNACSGVVRAPSIAPAGLLLLVGVLVLAGLQGLAGRRMWMR